jgi:uncharacterized protein YndB with AHSA1/START domain
MDATQETQQNNTYEIRHRVGIDAPVSEVYAAIATAEGGRRWWTEDVTLHGDPGVGGQLEFRFGGPDRGATMELVELTPSSRVMWRCVRGPAEWIDTTVTFELRGDDTGAETVVLFTHAGWREPVEFMHHCSSRWGYFLLSLKHALEGGKATPWPHDEHLSSWDR